MEIKKKNKKKKQNLDFGYKNKVSFIYIFLKWTMIIKTTNHKN